MKNKKSLIVCALTACVLLLGGCGGTGAADVQEQEKQEGAAGTVQETETQEKAEASGDSEEAVTLRVAWWGNQERNDRTVRMLELYTQKHPNVTFEEEFIDWGSYWEKLSVEAAAEELPDIIQMDYSYLLEYQSKGLLKGLNEYADSGSLDLSDCTESSVNSGMVDGELYALCNGISSQCLLYNKTVTDSLGIEVPEQWTWQEFLETAEQVYDATGKKIMILSNDERTMQNLARGMGEVLMPSDGSGLGIKDDTAPLKYFRLVEDSINSDYHVTVEELADNSVADLGFLQRDITWCEFTYSNMCVSVTADCDESYEWGLTMWPSYEGDSVQLNYVKPSQFFCVASNCEYPEEAAKVLDFITNSIEANDILLGERGVPIANAVAEHLGEKMEGIEKAALEYVLHVSEVGTTIDPPSPSGSGEVGSLVASLAEEVRYGQTSAEDAAASFFEDANAILQEAAE